MQIYDFYPKIFEKKIPLNLLDISSRNYSNWKKENLLFVTKKNIEEKDKKRERVLLNVFDAFWLSIVKELKKFNVDFNTIRELKNILFANVDLDNEKVDKTIKSQIIDSILKQIPKEHHQVIKPLLLDGSLFSAIDTFIDERNNILFKNIGLLLFQILVQEVSISLVLSKDNDVLEVVFFRNEINFPNSIDDETNRSIREIMNKKTYLNIPLVPLLAKLFENNDFDKYTFHYNLFNEKERKLIEALNNDNCKEIKVSKHSSGDITLNLSYEKDVKKEQAKEIRRMLGLKQYEKIEVTFRNDSHLIIKNTTKEILKK